MPANPNIKEAPAEYANATPATPGQLALYAKGAGIPDKDVPTAVAIALAESGGKQGIKGGPNSDGSFDYGLWQVNGNAHASLFGKWPDWWQTYNNARMMAAIYSGRGGKWDAWTTFTSGKYKEFLPLGVQGAEQPATATNVGETNEILFGKITDIFEDIGGQFTGLVNGVVQIAQGVFKAMVWIANPHNWGRVIVVAVGGALVVGALVVLSKPNTSVVDAVTAAPKAAVKTATAPVKVANKIKRTVA